MTPAKKKFSRRDVFLPANLFTTAVLFAGFYSIVAAVDGNFQTAGAAIIIAMILDGMDGRVARLTDTSTQSAGALMVSRFRYYSFKEAHPGRRIPVTCLIGILLIFILSSLDPPIVFLTLFGACVVSGPIYWLSRKWTIRPRQNHAG